MARVLVADDAAIARKIIVEMLVGGGHEVVGQAERGDEAVALHAELRPDVSVLDVNMPGLDGISAAGAICDASPGAKVIVASVLVDPGRLARAMAAGAVDYVMKPFEARQLLAAVEQALR